MSAAARVAIQAVWRIESARLIAGLTRLVRDERELLLARLDSTGL